jgi:hypothetical protein
MTTTADEMPQAEPPEFGSLRLLSGILTGLILRSDEQVRPRLTAIAQRANAAAGAAAAGQETTPATDLPSETASVQFRYFMTGLLLWGPVWVAQSAYNGFRFSLNAGQRAVRTADALTDNIVLRPFRRPLERQLARLEPFANGLINLGRRESARSRALADQAVAEAVDAIAEFIAASPEVQRLIDGVLAYAGRSPELRPLVDGVVDYAGESESVKRTVDDVVDYAATSAAVNRLVEDVLRYVLLSPRFSDLMSFIIQRASESPELAELIQEQLSQQATGLTGVVADNARDVTLIADSVLEAVVRRILRQPPRRTLPPSPLVGEPQIMYKAAAFKPGKLTHKVVGDDDAI